LQWRNNEFSIRSYSAREVLTRSVGARSLLYSYAGQRICNRMVGKVNAGKGGRHATTRRPRATSVFLRTSEYAKHAWVAGNRVHVAFCIRINNDKMIK